MEGHRVDVGAGFKTRPYTHQPGSINRTALPHSPFVVSPSVHPGQACRTTTPALTKPLAVLVHAYVAVAAADYQVVQDLDAQQLARRHQVLGDGDVVIAGRGVP